MPYFILGLITCGLSIVLDVPPVWSLLAGLWPAPIALLAAIFRTNSAPKPSGVASRPRINRSYEISPQVPSQER